MGGWLDVLWYLTLTDFFILTYINKQVELILNVYGKKSLDSIFDSKKKLLDSILDSYTAGWILFVI